MPNIQWSIGVDESRFVSGMENARNETTSTGKLIEEVFGRKLKQVISVVAIEQATQRTAEWAQQINAAAKHLGTTNEQLQTLHHIASATGVADDAVTGLFDNIQKSAQEAIQGNGDLIASFNKLGLSVGDLMSMTNAQIFSKVISSIPKGLSNSTDQYMRQSVQNITGTPENTLASIQAGYNATSGADLSGKAKGLSDTGAIATEQSIKDLSAIWAEVMTSFKEAGIALIPVAKILLGIIKTLADALGGIALIAQGLNEMAHGHIKSGASKLASIAVGGSKAVTDMTLTPVIGKLQSGLLNTLGIKNNLALQKGEALGNTAMTIGSAGETGMAQAGSWALRGLSKGSSKVGLRGLSKWAGTKAQGLDEGVIAANSKAADAARSQELNEKMATAFSDLETKGIGTPGFGARFAKSNRISGAILKAQPYLGPGIMAGIAGIAAEKNMLKAAHDPNSVTNQNVKPIGMPMSFMQMAGGSANLKIGGMFGVGSLLDKLVSLNQRMSDNLTRIAENTIPDKHTKILQNYGMMPGGGTFGGGVAGGIGGAGGW